jgi:GNAT superfamily N-acetyltransferase
MAAAAEDAGRVEVHPLTRERWADLEALFGPKGAVAGCWCMWWRQSSGEHDRAGNDGNRAALRRLVDRGQPPGLLAYRDGKPVGWCSLGPRDEFGRLNRSPKLKPVDDRPVWAVVCFYIARGHRKQGVGTALLDAAVEFAGANGATLVEGYPIDPTGGKVHAGFSWTGLLPMFEETGFEEVARRGGRPIVRRAP